VLPPATAVIAALVLPAEYVASSHRCFGVVLLEACTNETRNKFDFVLDGIPYRRASIVVFLFSSCSILMRSIAAMFLSMGSSAVVG